MRALLQKSRFLAADKGRVQGSSVIRCSMSHSGMNGVAVEYRRRHVADKANSVNVRYKDETTPGGDEEPLLSSTVLDDEMSSTLPRDEPFVSRRYS